MRYDCVMPTTTVTIRVQVQPYQGGVLAPDSFDLTLETPNAATGGNPLFIAAEANKAVLALAEKMQSHLEQMYGRLPAEATFTPFKPAA